MGCHLYASVRDFISLPCGKKKSVFLHIVPTGRHCPLVGTHNLDAELIRKQKITDKPLTKCLHLLMSSFIKVRVKMLSLVIHQAFHNLVGINVLDFKSATVIEREFGAVLDCLLIEV